MQILLLLQSSAFPRPLARVALGRPIPVRRLELLVISQAVPEAVKEERWHRFMGHQQAISARRLKRRVGTRQQVIIDEVRTGKAAAASLAVQPIVTPVRDPSELESAIVAQAREANGGIVVMPEAFTVAHRAEITSLAARYRLPAVYAYRVFAGLGGLLSYGSDLTDNFRRAATYADRIVKGVKPSELPVQAPVKFELVINMKTAKALGLDISTTVLARADEVIE